jgi:predicted transposase YdaD
MEDLMKDVIAQREEDARQEGRQEERKNIAISMIKLGSIKMEEIATATGLTMESLSAIKRSMKAAD